MINEDTFHCLGQCVAGNYLANTEHHTLTNPIPKQPDPDSQTQTLANCNRSRGNQSLGSNNLANYPLVSTQNKKVIKKSWC